MPPVLKTLVTISVWVLFIVGWIATITTGVMMVMAGMAGVLPPMVAVVNGSAGGAFFILACVGAKIRQGMK
jgi:hypothetical protein